MASLKDTVRRFCRRTGLPVPATVFGSTDEQVLQAMALLEEEGNDLALRGRWQALVREASHTTVAQEDQGAISAIAPHGFRFIINDTIWDRTNRLPVLGPNSPQNWQALKATSGVSPRYTFRIRGGRLLVMPAPPAGLDWRFEYQSSYWIVNGTTYRQYFEHDDDEILLPDEVVLLGLRWRWKKEKGLEYAEDMRTYEAQLKDALGRDGGRRALSMDCAPESSPRPGIFVPQGNWPL